MLAYLNPEKAFERYIPKLLRFCEDPNITHDSTLRNLRAIINPLLFSETFPKKFFYLNMILETAIKEVIAVISTSNKLALDLISNLLHFLPLPHKTCLQEAYQSTTPKPTIPYSRFLLALKQSHDDVYFYHVLCNSMEDRLCELLSRILTNMDGREKPNKDDIDDYSQIVQDVAENMYRNMMQPVFDGQVAQLMSFLKGGVHLNCLNEISMLLRSMAKRAPQAVADAIIPHVLHALLRKATDAAPWTSPLGAYFKLAAPALHEKAAKFSLNTFISNDHCAYYCNMLCPILLYDIHKTSA